MPDAIRPDSPDFRLQIIGHIARAVNQCHVAGFRLGGKLNQGSSYEAASALSNAGGALMLACAKLRRMHPAIGPGPVNDTLDESLLDMDVAKVKGFLSGLDTAFLSCICGATAKANDLDVAEQLERIAFNLSGIRSWLESQG